MTEHARIAGSRTAPSTGRKRRVRRPKHRYFAFLSYSHKDEEVADWLHRELEDFRVPSALVGKITENGVIPKRLTPVFRDRHELAAASDLSEEIEQALIGSQFMVVLCSPSAAASRWTNAEIECFKRHHPDGCVLAVISSGEPFASEVAGREDEECFPPALRQKFDRIGRPTGRKAEPLAADIREEGHRRIGFLKLVAGMLGVGLDDLVQRETTRRHRRLAWLTAASLAGMALTSLLALTAIQSRDEARDQRREAEGLVAFMLGDLKDKLEPIGRLDALDGVGERVLAYYRKQDTADLSDDALRQRSGALSLSADVAYQRGNLNNAARLYREAAEGTGEAVRREPSDPERLFDHAQNVFALGAIDMRRGDYNQAAKAVSEYRSLADRMTAIAPENLKYRMEVQYANFNLGIVLMKQRRFADADARFRKALDTIEAIAAVDPTNENYQGSVADSVTWLATAEVAQSKLSEAIAHRKRVVELLTRLSEGRSDVSILERLLTARIKLGRLLAVRDDSGEAESELAQAAALAERLTAQEPNNRQWLEYEAITRLTRAQLWFDTGNPAATSETAAACAIVDRLIARDASIVDWQADQLICLELKARLALARGDLEQAVEIATRAMSIARAFKTADKVADEYLRAGFSRLLGDVYRQTGDSARAKQVWEAGLANLPKNGVEQPFEAAERAALLQRLGMTAEAARISGKLKAQGIRFADILAL